MSHILSFLAMSLIDLKIQEDEFQLSYDIKITLKWHFWHEKVKILSLLIQRCYGRHYITLLDM